MSTHSSGTDTIDIADVQSGQVQVRGTLGVPLGSVVAVQGLWIPYRVSPGAVTKMPGEARLEISIVNGRRLSKPVPFKKSDIRAILYSAVAQRSIDNWEQGEHTLLVFETCQFDSTPAAAWGDGDSPVAETRPFGVYPILNIVRDLDPNILARGRQCGE